jgi:hypothetical protein
MMKWYKTSERLPKDGQSVWVMDLDEHGDIAEEPKEAVFHDDEEYPGWAILTREYITHGDLLWLDGLDDINVWTRWRPRRTSKEE